MEDVRVAVADHSPRWQRWGRFSRSPIPAPLPGRNRLRIDPQAQLGGPGLSLKPGQVAILGCVLAIMPGHPLADLLVVDRAAIGEDHLGHRPTVAIPILLPDRYVLAERQV